MSEIEQTKQKCQRCKYELLLEEFKKKRDGTYPKTCIVCCNKLKEYRDKSKCPHGKRKTRCKDCGGGSICEHSCRRYICKICNPIGHLSKVMKDHIRRVVTKEADDANIEKYWHCSVEEYRKYLSDKLTGDMTWENYCTLWEIDHIVPLEYNEPSMAEMIARLHYLNTQPLLIVDNRKKNNRHRDDASDELLSMLSELSIQPEDSASNV
jgi:hypothetical protein